jgi:hypothetical protein
MIEFDLSIEGQNSIELGVSPIDDVTLDFESPETVELHILQQGPPGPAGTVLVIRAAETMSGHRVIMTNSSGEAGYADCRDTTAFAATGFLAGAVTAGGLCDVVLPGQSLDWPAGGLTPLLPVYLAENGLVSQVPPVTGWIRQVAVALSATLVLVDIGPVYYSGA